MPKEPKEKKPPKPKVQFRIQIEIMDNGKISTNRTEFYQDDVTEKRTHIHFEHANSFLKNLNASLYGDSRLFARDVLLQIGVDPLDFAKWMEANPSAANFDIVENKDA
jgi:hypothetical protein